MYETLSKKYIGNIDSIKKEGNLYIVRGWVVPVLDTGTCSIGCEGFVSLAPEERKDIYSLYKECHVNYLRSGFIITFKPTKEKTIINVSGDETFSIDVDMAEVLFKPNFTTKPEIIIVDNFYSDPFSIRKLALEQTFVELEDNVPGCRSSKSFLPSWIKKHFEDLLGTPIKEFVGSSGSFHNYTSLNLIKCNKANSDYVALIYLNPDAPTKSGISMLKSKITKLTHLASRSDAHEFGDTIENLNSKSFNNDMFFDKMNFESLDIITNIFNRLVIINSKHFYTDTNYFGTDKENGLLQHVFFFNL